MSQTTGGSALNASDVQSEQPFVQKDNRFLAFVTMNFAVLAVTGMTATFRVIAEEDFSPVDFTLMRNLLALLVSYVWCKVAQHKPFPMFPRDRKQQVLWRCVMGQASYFLIKVTVTMVPLALIMVIWNTCPFFISVIAFLFLSEPISRLEIFAMVLCFCAVVFIAQV